MCTFGFAMASEQSQRTRVRVLPSCLETSGPARSCAQFRILHGVGAAGRNGPGFVSFGGSTKSCAVFGIPPLEQSESCERATCRAKKLCAVSDPGWRRGSRNERAGLCLPVRDNASARHGDEAFVSAEVRLSIFELGFYVPKPRYDYETP